MEQNERSLAVLLVSYSWLRASKEEITKDVASAIGFCEAHDISEEVLQSFVNDVSSTVNHVNKGTSNN